jgi:endonuclease III
MFQIMMRFDDNRLERRSNNSSSIRNQEFIFAQYEKKKRSTSEPSSGVFSYPTKAQEQSQFPPAYGRHSILSSNVFEKRAGSAWWQSKLNRLLEQLKLIKDSVGVEAERDIWKEMVPTHEEDKHFSFQILEVLLCSKMTTDKTLKTVAPKLCRVFPSIESIVTQPAAQVVDKLLGILHPLGLQNRKAKDIVFSAHQLVADWLQQPQHPKQQPPKKKKKLTKKPQQPKKKKKKKGPVALPSKVYTLDELKGLPSVKDILQKKNVLQDLVQLTALRALHGANWKIAHLFMEAVFGLQTGIPVDRHVRRFAISFGQGMACWTDHYLQFFLGRVYASSCYVMVNVVVGGIAQLLADSKVKENLASNLRQLARSEKCVDEMECFLAFYNA